MKEEKIETTEITNEELLNLFNSIEEHITYLNESILEEKDEEDETPTI